LNSRGLNLDDRNQREQLEAEIQEALAREWRAMPLVGGERWQGASRPVDNPADRKTPAGIVTDASAEAVEQALSRGAAAVGSWARTAPGDRAKLLENAAERLEGHRSELAGLCVREGGRTLPDALSEVREAVDFCRYYAQLLREDFGRTRILPGPTGEENRLSLHGRGLFVCISPWNFPIAIFTGQITAALAVGNPVIAKPASETPLVGMRIVELFHAAGVPVDVLHYLPGRGSLLGPLLLKDPRVAGVAFTGSTETAREINVMLAARPGPIIPLIAETGGQNAMIVDSSALLEQATTDILQSAFNSAGQRCSALRLLFIQQDIADSLIEMLEGAMGELSMGDPMRLATDIGPVINESARDELTRHAERMYREATLLYRTPLPAIERHGSFFAPLMVELPDAALLHKEVFGPVLHVIRYPVDSLDRVIQSIEQTGYGLTLGIHSRIQATVDYLRERLSVGNIYINRNMIGAVVGVQPFGGEGLSGTGPKSGGPYTLFRYATERSVTVNTAAVGGNARLLSLEE